MNQNLFNALQDVYGFNALEVDLSLILRAIEKDRQEQFAGCNGSIFTNDPIILKDHIQRNNVRINMEIRKKKEHRDKFMISVWRLENESMQKYLS